MNLAAWVDQVAVLKEGAAVARQVFGSCHPTLDQTREGCQSGWRVSVGESSRGEESTQFERLTPDEPFCFCRTDVGVSSVRRPYTIAREIQFVMLPSPLPCLDALRQATGTDNGIPDQCPIWKCPNHPPERIVGADGGSDGDGS